MPEQERQIEFPVTLEDIEPDEETLTRQKQQFERMLALEESKQKMAAYLPGGSKHTGALFKGERPGQA